VGVQFIASAAIAPGYNLTAIVDIVQSGLLLSVVLAMSTNISETHNRSKLFWVLMSLGCAGWLCAQILWTYFEVFLKQSVPNPFIGDVVLFLHLVPMMAALAVRPHREAEQWNSRLGSLDFTLLFVWWLFLYLFIVIPWQYISIDGSLYGRNFDILYSIGHLVFISAIILVMRRSVGAWRTTYKQFLGASFMYAIGSISSSLAIDFGSYHSGGIYDVPIGLSLVWFTYAGLTASEQVATNDYAEEISGRRNAWIARSANIAALSLPVLGLWALLDNRLPMHVKVFRLWLSFIAVMVVGSLRSFRQHKLDEGLDQAHEDLREDSLTDSLTGARNRRFFTSTIEGDVQQAIRAYGPEALSHDKRNRDLIFYLIDADCFKEVNDRYGHDLGDRVLAETARRISSAIRNSDVLIRWGGDEFLVVSRYTDRIDAETLAARVLEAVGGTAFELTNHHLQRSCSVGWAVFPWFLDSPAEVPYEEILQLADCALYEAKTAGRNRAVGMLPSRQNVSLPLRKSGGGSPTLTERLCAATIHSQGPVLEAASVSRAKAASVGAAVLDI
jgi:diguanylate cyclase (GGDEF)-like protein